MRVFTAMSITNMVNKANTEVDENGGNVKLIPPEFILDYEEVAAAMGLRTKLSVGEEMRTRLLDYPEIWKESHPGENSPTLATDPRMSEYKNGSDAYIKERVKNIKSDARKQLMYKYMDAQLMATWKKRGVSPILPGFTKTMLTGTSAERKNMILVCAVNYTLNQEGVLGSDIVNSQAFMTAMNNAVEKQDIKELTDIFTKKDERTTFLFGVLDETINKKFSINLPQGTTENLYNYIRGKDMSANFIDMGEAFIGSAIGGFADKQLGLPQGTSYQLYKIGSGVMNHSIGQADAAMLVVQLLFGEQLAKLDAALGIPPGSLSALISALVYGGPIAWAMFAFTLIFGFVKQEIQITCPGDPVFIAGGPTTQWCRAEDEMPRLLESWAQINVQRIITDMLRIDEPTRTNDPNLFPTIIGTYRHEDVDYLHGRTTLANGQKSENIVDDKYSRYIIFRGMRDLWQSDYMGEFVHFGY